MNKSNRTPHEPTHDEIALCAFLLWEKEGRQPGHEQAYWLQAEAQLRRHHPERAASLAAPAWPPSAAAAPKLATARAITPAAAKPARVATASRAVAPKSAAVAKSAAAAKPARKSTPAAPARRALARA